MTLARLFLGFSVLVWLPYGLYLVVQPGFLAGAAGITAGSATGTTELRAMYGGLQAALGLLALAGLLRPALRRTALTTLGTLTAGLGLARALGVVLDGGMSGYTASALVFEWGSAALAVAALRLDGVEASKAP